MAQALRPGRGDTPSTGQPESDDREGVVERERDTDLPPLQC
jgi:hypothetical protein